MLPDAITLPFRDYPHPGGRLDSRGCHSLLAEKGNQTWQTVEGRIFHAVHFTEDELGRGGANQVRVMYSYQVNGEFYSGELLHSFATFGQAERFSSRYKKDLPVIIRVHPHKPDVSVFREDDNAARLTQATATF